ncbi:MAG: hypothetical protein MUE81_03855 [Thermoflexibacter sp.]|nr:hypothetical protein [Thermoflexibacter sp.]
MKKIDSILADLEKLFAQTSISAKQIDKLVDSLVYTPFKQYLLCLKVGVKAEDATTILLKKLAEDIFEKTPFAEMRLRSGISESALQETVNQPVLLIAKSLFKASKNEKGDVTSLKLETLPIENYESSIAAYLSYNEFVVITNFKEVFIFDKEAIEDFKPMHQLGFGEFISLSTQKSSIAEILTSFESTENQEVILKSFSKTVEKLAKDKAIDELLFVKYLENYSLLPHHFLEKLYIDNQQLWQSQKAEFVYEQFANILAKWLATFYAFQERNPQGFQNLAGLSPEDFERLIFTKNEKIKSLSDYNYRKINEYTLGKAFENLYDINNDFPEEIYDIFCEKLISQLLDSQIDKIIESIDKNHLKKAKQQFEEVQKITILNPFFGSGILLSKLLQLIFKQYQRIGNQINAILDEKQSLLDKDENWQKLATLKEELGLNDLRKLIANLIQNQLFISFHDEPQETIKKEQSRLLKIAKLNLYLSAIKLAPSAFHFKKTMPEEEKKAYAKFEYPSISPASFSAIFFMLSLEKWKNKEYKNLIFSYFKLAGENGFLSFAIPSALLFNETDKEIRELLLVKNTLLDVQLFEQGKTEWCLLHIQKKQPAKNQIFHLTIPSNESANEHLTFDYKNDLIAGFSPTLFSLIPFNQHIDYQICSKIRGDYPTFAESGFHFKSEFKISNDSNFFLRSQEEGTLPLCEGKNIDSYTFSNDFKYFIPKEKAHTQLLSQEVNSLKKTFELSQKNYEIIGIFNDKGFLLNYQCERLVLKQIKSKQDKEDIIPTNQYFIATLLPANTFVEGNLLYLNNLFYQKNNESLIQEQLPVSELIFLLALINSFVLNFYSKQIQLQDVTYLPLPQVNIDLKKQVIEKAWIVLYNQNNGLFKDLGKALGVSSPSYLSNPIYSDLRLELEDLIAQEVFGLDVEEFEYLKGQF